MFDEYIITEKDILAQDIEDEYEEKEKKIGEDVGAGFESKDEQKIVDQEFRVFLEDPNWYKKITHGAPTVLNLSLSTDIAGSGQLQKLQRLFEKSTRTVEETYKIALLGYSKLLQIPSSQLTDLVALIDSKKIPSIQYKNPLALMIALKFYTITNTKLLRKNIEKSVNEINKYYKIRDVDIYRYIRFLRKRLL